MYLGLLIALVYCCEVGTLKEGCTLKNGHSER